MAAPALLILEHAQGGPVLVNPAAISHGLPIHEAGPEGKWTGSRLVMVGGYDIPVTTALEDIAAGPSPHPLAALGLADVLTLIGLARSRAEDIGAAYAENPGAHSMAEAARVANVDRIFRLIDGGAK